MVNGRILVVEDEHIVAMGIQVMLKSLEYTVTGVASSGEDAVSKAESTRSDLVLMDIMLKGNLNGVEASKEIITRFDIQSFTLLLPARIIQSLRGPGIQGLSDIL